MKTAATLRHAVHDGITVAYEDTGPGKAPAVVLVHGFTDSRRMWRRLLPMLTSRFRVLAVDLPGHGDSDRISDHHDLDEVALVPLLGEAIREVCHHAGVDRVAVVGHSLGGAVAAYLAATEPGLLRGALLIDPALFIVDPDVFSTTPFAALFAALEPVLRDAQATDDPESALATVLAAAPSMTGHGTFFEALGPEAAADLAHSWARAEVEIVQGAVDGGGDPAAFWGAHSPDAPVTVPITVIRADPTLGPAFFAEHEARLHRSTPHAEVIEATGCSHLVHIDAPELLAGHVMRFLDSTTDDSSEHVRSPGHGRNPSDRGPSRSGSATMR